MALTLSEKAEGLNQFCGNVAANGNEFITMEIIGIIATACDALEACEATNKIINCVNNDEISSEEAIKEIAKAMEAVKDYD